MRIFLLAGVFFLALFTPSKSQPTVGKDIVTVDYQMAEKAIEWLEFIRSGADSASLRKAFMEKIAPTKGCQAIIHHWARFKKWNEEEFFYFLMRALDNPPSQEPRTNKDGTLTDFGIRRKLWLDALANPEKLRKNIAALKKAALKDTAMALAKKYLPQEAIISNDFYIVLFGASSAFSVGRENGFDLLQLPKTDEGSIDIQRTIQTLAHEMHHTGFSYCHDQYMSEVKNSENILLVGLLAAEGMPTYFINKPFDQLEKLKSSKEESNRQLAKDWKTHLARLPELYVKAAKDVQLNLEGKIGQKEIFKNWMSGMQGPAYVLGANMFFIIEKYLGVDSARVVARDFRRFLLMYNAAAKKAKRQGDPCFIFDEDLVDKVAAYTGNEKVKQ